uniref:Uncharacterized protein n=1 Tax=Anguilla anguilla TaxID=7936 RepID=A0A0E9TCP4_ANGAN
MPFYQTRLNNQLGRVWNCVTLKFLIDTDSQQIKFHN